MCENLIVASGEHKCGQTPAVIAVPILALSNERVFGCTQCKNFLGLLPLNRLHSISNVKRVLRVSRFTQTQVAQVEAGFS